MIDKNEFIKIEGQNFPGKSYVDTLLKPIFYYQRDNLFGSMFNLHKAHVVMLQEQNILSSDEATKILTGLNDLEKMDHKEINYSPEYEDLFFMVEAKLGEKIGQDLAGNLHIGRSRNDMGEGMYRIEIRKHILSLIADVDNLSEAFLEQAKNHINSIMPAHTHTQPAQPTTFGHYLLGIFDNLQRDRDRLWNAFKTVNQSPLGAAAITTTGFPINRERLAELLGFQGIMENSYDAIGASDYLLESAQVVVSLMINTGRWIQEFLRFASLEVGILKIADPYVQISSIMPQKRNPVSVEHSRALASKSVGESLTVIQMLHNTPYGDINDTEDDLQPTIYNSYGNASRVMRLMYAVTRTMTFNTEHAAQESRKNMITITELADVLKRDHGLSFRKAHSIAAQISKLSTEKGKELYEWHYNEINDFLDNITLSESEWQAIIDPKTFVERRSVRGGPSPIEVQRMIENRKEVIKKNKDEYEEIQNHLNDSQQLLLNQVSSFVKK